MRVSWIPYIAALRWISACAGEDAPHVTTAPPDELNKAPSLSQGGKDGDEAPYQTEYGAGDAHVPGRLIIQRTPELTDAVNADAGKGAPFSRWAWPEPMREAFAELRVHA